VPAEQVVDDIRRYSLVCDHLTLLEFIGGEPFLHPRLEYILRQVLDIANIGVIHVFTNGTVFPDAVLLRALKHPRIVVYVSNYSVSLPKKINDKIARTLDELQRSGIAFVRGSNANWYDFSSFDPVQDDEQRLHERYEACFLHTCNRLHRGRLYRCPHHFSGVMLGHLDDIDVVDIHETGLAKKLEAFAAQPTARPAAIARCRSTLHSFLRENRHDGSRSDCR